MQVLKPVSHTWLTVSENHSSPSVPHMPVCWQSLAQMLHMLHYSHSLGLTAGKVLFLLLGIRTRYSPSKVIQPHSSTTKPCTPLSTAYAPSSVASCGLPFPGAAGLPGKQQGTPLILLGTRRKPFHFIKPLALSFPVLLSPFPVLGVFPTKSQPSWKVLLNQKVIGLRPPPFSLLPAWLLPPWPSSVPASPLSPFLCTSAHEGHMNMHCLPATMGYLSMVKNTTHFSTIPTKARMRPISSFFLFCRVALFCFWIQRLSSRLVSPPQTTSKPNRHILYLSIVAHHSALSGFSSSR